MKKITNKDLLDKYTNEIMLSNSTNLRVDFDKHADKADKYRKEILKRMEKNI